MPEACRAPVVFAHAVVSKKTSGPQRQLHLIEPLFFGRWALETSRKEALPASKLAREAAMLSWLRTIALNGSISDNGQIPPKSNP